MYCRFVDLRIILRAAAGLTFSDALQEKNGNIYFLHSASLGYRRIFGQNSIVSYWPGKQALAYYWLKEFANSTLAYLIIC